MADLIPDIIKDPEQLPLPAVAIVGAGSKAAPITEALRGSTESIVIMDELPVLECEPLEFHENDIIRDLKIESIDAGVLEYAKVRKPSPHKQKDNVIKAKRKKGKAAKIARRINRK